MCVGTYLHHKDNIKFAAGDKIVNILNCTLEDRTYFKIQRFYWILLFLVPLRYMLYTYDLIVCRSSVCHSLIVFGILKIVDTPPPSPPTPNVTDEHDIMVLKQGFIKNSLQVDIIFFKCKINCKHSFESCNTINVSTS